MPRALFASLTIVAAFQCRLAAAPSLVEDAPVSPQVVALAARLNIDPLRDRVRFMADVARGLYSTPDSRPPQLTVAGAVGAPLLTVPVPLPAMTWSAAVFKHPVPSDQLVTTILSDRRATLLCRGLAGLDDETLTYLNEHPAIITMLYERAAGNFAAFGQALKIHHGRVLTPGGERYALLWEDVLLVPPGNPALFIRALFTDFRGRLAYLLDTLDAASPQAVQFALGAWLPETVRRPRFKSLAAAVSASYDEWRPAEYPFIRPLGDLAMLLLRLRFDERSAPAAPVSRALWRDVLDSDGGDLLSGDTVDAAWLVWATGSDDMYTRLSRLDQISFGQRLFAHGAVSSATAIEVVGGFRRYRMLLLTLERMGVTDAGTYALAVQRAGALGALSDGHRFWTVAQFQGTVAYLDGLRRAGTIDSVQAQALVRSLAALPLSSNGYNGRLTEWWRTELVAVLPRADEWEHRAIAALAGRSPQRELRLAWEGQFYRIDVPFAERQRLATVRAKQGGATLDIAFTLHDVARQLRGNGLTLADVRTAARSLSALARESAVRLRHPAVMLMPPGVDPPRDALEWVSDAAQRLGRLRSAGELPRTAPIGESLQSLADVLFGHVLMSMVYAANLGDPAGAALLGGNVALRHDFGFGRPDSDGRLRQMWAQPRQQFQPGVPWHVGGSLLGLDIGLAPLVVQRSSIERLPEAPTLSSIEREGLAVGVVLIDPLRLTEDDRDRIAASIARGRARVRAAATPEAATELADELGFDGYRRRALLAAVGGRRPAAVLDEFTIADLLALGGAAHGADLDAWGTPALYSFGCACTSYVTSRSWRVLDGRAHLPMMAATMGDLNLTIAVMLRDLRVPVALHKNVLAIGLQSVIDGLGVRGDWRGLTQAARELGRQRVEDFVSSAAFVDGPLVPIEDNGSTREH